MTDSTTTSPVAGSRGGLASGPDGRVSKAGGIRNGTMRGTVAATNSPPWHGAVNIGLIFAAAAWIITYTLLPLPGQVDLGDWNYVGGAACFVTAIVMSRVLRVTAERRFRARRAASTPDTEVDAASTAGFATRPEFATLPEVPIESASAAAAD